MFRASRVAAARQKFSIGEPGACTTNATASATDSLRIVWGVLPASGTTSPAVAVSRRTGALPTEVERELSLEHVVDLAGRVTVHDGWSMRPGAFA